jgi:hypothetical protein
MPTDAVQLERDRLVRRAYDRGDLVRVRTPAGERLVAREFGEEELKTGRYPVAALLWRRGELRTRDGEAVAAAT